MTFTSACWCTSTCCKVVLKLAVNYIAVYILFIMGVSSFIRLQYYFVRVNSSCPSSCLLLRICVRMPGYLMTQSPSTGMPLPSLWRSMCIFVHSHSHTQHKEAMFLRPETLVMTYALPIPPIPCVGLTADQFSEVRLVLRHYVNFRQRQQVGYCHTSSSRPILCMLFSDSELILSGCVTEAMVYWCTVCSSFLFINLIACWS